MEKKVYLKLGELDGKSFTVEKAWGYQFQKWDEGSSRFLREEKWQESMRGDRGWQKKYDLDTTDGKLSVSEAQIKTMLAAAYKNGVANIVGVTFKVKKVVGQNDIPNYYFNVDHNATPKTTQDKVVEDIGDEPINLDDIGF